MYTTGDATKTAVIRAVARIDGPKVPPNNMNNGGAIIPAAITDREVTTRTRCGHRRFMRWLVKWGSAMAWVSAKI
jgi:hypothetical protein